MRREAALIAVADFLAEDQAVEVPHVQPGEHRPDVDGPRVFDLAPVGVHGAQLGGPLDVIDARGAYVLDSRRFGAPVDRHVASDPAFGYRLVNEVRLVQTALRPRVRMVLDHHGQRRPLLKGIECRAVEHYAVERAGDLRRRGGLCRARARRWAFGSEQLNCGRPGARGDEYQADDQGGHDDDAAHGADDDPRAGLGQALPDRSHVDLERVSHT